jgi:glycosyltransferase involved in cell wall biosynthesis
MSCFKISVIFDNFGPYHLARLQTAAAVCDLLAVEVAARSAEYEWDRREYLGAKSKEQRPWKKSTLIERGTSREVSSRDLVVRLNQVLDDFLPQAVFIPGWSSKATLAALQWSLEHGVPVVCMSESTEWDERRRAWREMVKRRIVGLCSAALVGGSPHKDYMVKLGMPVERVFLGYDAVDNRYFADKVAEVRSAKCEVRTKFALPENYFLASARFVEKKNLTRLIEAYARYRLLASKAETGKLPDEVASQRLHGPGKAEIWDLVILGDGVLRESLTTLRSALGLDACVHLPGFKQYPDLPAYYGLANVFIHASTTEQWGLVVNEAMASSLPVLVSNRCGCAADLVKEGVNGFTFDPCDAEQLAQLMLKISTFNFLLSAFGDASRKVISNWGPERFAKGLKAAADCALKVGPKSGTFLDKALLNLLLRR